MQPHPSWIFKSGRSHRHTVAVQTPPAEHSVSSTESRRQPASGQQSGGNRIHRKRLSDLVRGPRAPSPARHPRRRVVTPPCAAACVAQATDSEARRLAAGRYEAVRCPKGRSWPWACAVAQLLGSMACVLVFTALQNSAASPEPPWGVRRAPMRRLQRTHKVMARPRPCPPRDIHRMPPSRRRNCS